MGGRTVQWTLQRKILKLRCRMLYNWSELFSSAVILALFFKDPKVTNSNFQPNFSGDISPALSSECGDTPPGWLPGPRVYTFSGSNLPLTWQDHFQETFGKRCCYLVPHNWRVGDSDKRVGPGRYRMKLWSNKATTTGSSSSDELWPRFGTG